MSGSRYRAWDRLGVSFDVFFQRFLHGEVLSGGGELMRQVLQSFITSEQPEHHFLLLECADGTADVYLHGDDMMANQVSGEEAWDLLVRGAREAGWVILPIGCATCITDEAQHEHLPEGLDEGAVLVATGNELLSVIEASRMTGGVS